MTDQTEHPSAKGFDPYAEGDGAEDMRAPAQDHGQRSEAAGTGDAAASEAITRATSALGDDDGAQR